MTITISPKASAALSRRCLQNTIRLAKGIERRTLFDEIERVLEDGLVSSELAEILHAVRELGNFGAHPLRNEDSGEIVNVTPEEAEMNLEVLDGIFEEWFVRPARRAEQKSKVSEKLTQIGKKPLE